jgi:cob(I)alamin adenosyltransferase
MLEFLKGVQGTGEDTFLAQQPNVKTTFMKTGFTWDTQEHSIFITLRHLG